MHPSAPPNDSQQRGKDVAAAMDHFIVVELDLDQFNSAVQRQLWQIVILSVVLLLVGAGGWLSLLTLQGFKGTRSRLQQIRAFNDLLVETLPVGLIATDESGRIQMVNAAAEKITGRRVDLLLGKPYPEALPRVLAQMFANSARDRQAPWSSEETMHGGDGAQLNLYLTAISVRDENGAVTGEVLLLQDVSNLRQLEDEVRRNERLAALGKMAAGVAHELRNPLSSIKGLAVLLKERVGKDQEGIRTADVLVQEVERLNRSISELLAYARPEKLQLAVVSLRQIVGKATMLVGVDATAQGIQLIEEYAEGGDHVLADEDRMTQVFLNLLLNAIQAMPDGGELRVVTRHEQGRIVCHVEDNGTGIAKEHLGRVLDPYFTTKSDGTGLGLALSAKIIEEHRGTITLTSQDGKGTQVTVSLPKATAS